MWCARVAATLQTVLKAKSTAELRLHPDGDNRVEGSLCTYKCSYWQ